MESGRRRASRILLLASREQGLDGAAQAAADGFRRAAPRGGAREPSSPRLELGPDGLHPLGRSRHQQRPGSAVFHLLLQPRAEIENRRRRHDHGIVGHPIELPRDRLELLPGRRQVALGRRDRGLVALELEQGDGLVGADRVTLALESGADLTRAIGANLRPPLRGEAPIGSHHAVGASQESAHEQRRQDRQGHNAAADHRRARAPWLGPDLHRVGAAPARFVFRRRSIFWRCLHQRGLSGGRSLRPDARALGFGGSGARFTWYGLTIGAFRWGRGQIWNPRDSNHLNLDERRSCSIVVEKALGGMTVKRLARGCGANFGAS